MLDVLVLAPRGLFGWGSVLASVLTRKHMGHSQLDRLRGTVVVISAHRPAEAEVDGDPIGERQDLAIRVLPSALMVRGG